MTPVGSVSRSNGTPVTRNKVDYYVDHDWALPIGYVYFRPDNILPKLAVSMWFKGETNGADLAAYLFYKGKQIGSTKEQGSASTTEAEARTVSGDKGNPTWQLWIMEWYNVAATAKDPANPNERIFYLDKNPGEYEVKVLRKGTLSRQANFTVGADGQIVVPGAAGKEAFSGGRLALPVKVLGTLDGAWDKSAWKAGAFYGNPLKEFAPVP